MNKFVYTPKYEDKVDWITLEKRFLQDKITEFKESLIMYNQKLKKIIELKCQLTIKDYYDLNCGCVDPKLLRAYIYKYEIRLEHLEKGLFKTQEEYFTNGIY